MPRRDRHDGRGTIHHVMSRGLARRTIFRCRADRRFFLALLAWEVKRGFIVIYAFVLMDNHYHLLLGSPRGRLSQAMNRINSRYARHFNRRLDRDGPLFRSRFKSIPVEDSSYWAMLTSYIEQNPVKAGLVRKAADYPYSSAHHRSAPKRPRWIAGSLAASSGAESPRELTIDESWLIDRMLSARHAPPLKWSGPQREETVRSWVSSRARVADGDADLPPAAAPHGVIEGIKNHAALCPEWTVRINRKFMPGWIILQAGLLRTLCCLRYEEISEMSGIGLSSARTYAKHHLALLQGEPKYADRCAAVTTEALQRLHQNRSHRDLQPR